MATAAIHGRDLENAISKLLEGMEEGGIKISDHQRDEIKKNVKETLEKLFGDYVPTDIFKPGSPVESTELYKTVKLVIGAILEKKDPSLTNMPKLDDLAVALFHDRYEISDSLKEKVANPKKVVDDFTKILVDEKETLEKEPEENLEHTAPTPKPAKTSDEELQEQSTGLTRSGNRVALEQVLADVHGVAGQFVRVSAKGGFGGENRGLGDEAENTNPNMIGTEEAEEAAAGIISIYINDYSPTTENSIRPTPFGSSRN